MLQSKEAEYVKVLSNVLYDVQKERISIDNRLSAFLNNGGKVYQSGVEDLVKRLSDLTNKMEATITKDLSIAVARVPIIQWLEKVHGIGPRLSGSLVGTIGNIELFMTVSALWAYCGLHTVPVCQNCKKLCFSGKEEARFLNRQAQRRWELHMLKTEESEIGDEEIFIRKAYIESEKQLCSCDEPAPADRAPKREFYKKLLLTWNPFMRTTCWKIAGQFVKQGKFYRTYYEQRKEYYTGRDGDQLSKGHIDNRAKRATVKLFLSHLFEMWRRSEGLPSGMTYLQYKLGDEFSQHHTLIEPPHGDIYRPVEGDV